jgi:hypothetical protein
MKKAASNSFKLSSHEIAISGGAGPMRQFCGTGIHRDFKKQPKGGRRGQSTKAIREYER